MTDKGWYIKLTEKKKISTTVESESEDPIKKITKEKKSMSLIWRGKYTSERGYVKSTGTRFCLFNSYQ